MAKTPYVDQDACISCGLCVEMAPEVFRMDAEDLAEVKWRRKMRQVYKQ